VRTNRSALSAWLGAVVVAAPAVALGQQAVVEKSFDVYLVDPNGVQVVQSDVVPLLPGQACFGWRIRLDGADRLIKATETLELPEAPAVWSGEGDEYSPTKIVNDRKTAVTTMFHALDEGWFGSVWCIAEGDPVGPHTIAVHVDEHLLAEFDFTVEAVR